MTRRLIPVVLVLALGVAAPARAGAPITARPTCAHSYLYALPGASRSDYRAALVCLVNAARKAEHLPALKRSSKLEAVAQAQSDKFAATGSANHGTSLTDITKRFARHGYRAAAYNEGFSVLDGAASPYAFLAEVVARAGVPCTEVFDPRFRDIGLGVSSAAGGSVTTLAIELGRKVGTSQPSSNTKAAATCGHKVPAPVVAGPVVDGAGPPTATDTTVTVSLRCRAKLACAFTASAELPHAKAQAAPQQLTIAAGQTQSVSFTFDASALSAERAAAQPAVGVRLGVTAPAEYTDTMTAALPAASPPTAAAARAAPKSCTRGGATTVASEARESVVAVKAKPVDGYPTAKLYACAASTGKRVYLFSSTLPNDERHEDDAFTFIDGRHLGVTVSIGMGIGGTYKGAVYDLKTGRPTHTTRPCDDYSLSDTDSGPDAIVFLPGGGIAYTCGRLRIADAKGDRDVEPAGSEVSHLAYGNGRLYWTLTVGGQETVKSLDV
jgi:uncharacterized protein YkwD